MTLGKPLARLEYAPRGLIGVLTPQANTTVEPEFSLLWPPGVAMLNARLCSDKDTIEARLGDYWQDVGGTLGQFANAPLDAYAFACTGASYLAEAAGEDALVAALEQRYERSFITAALAVTQALQALNARRIALVSPYPDGLTAASVRYWQSRGFTVTEVATAFRQGDAFHPIYSLDTAAVTAALAPIRQREVDAVVLLGTGMPTLAAIAAGAAAPGAPVLSCMLALAWRCVLAVDHAPLTAASLRPWLRGAHWIDNLRRLQPLQSR